MQRKNKEQKKTVLFAEDNPEDRIPVADYLRAHGLEVLEVTNPKAAIDCVAAHKKGVLVVDAIVLDLRMLPSDPEGGEKVLRFMRDP